MRRCALNALCGVQNCPLPSRYRLGTRRNVRRVHHRPHPERTISWTVERTVIMSKTSDPLPIAGAVRPRYLLCLVYLLHCSDFGRRYVPILGTFAHHIPRGGIPSITSKEFVKPLSNNISCFWGGCRVSRPKQGVGLGGGVCYLQISPSLLT